MLLFNIYYKLLLCTLFTFIFIAFLNNSNVLPRVLQSGRHFSEFEQVTSSLISQGGTDFIIVVYDLFIKNLCTANKQNFK